MENTFTPIISVHFPKASGSSIKTSLVRALGADNVLDEYRFDPIDPANPMYIFPEKYFLDRPESITPFKAVHGHFSPIHFEEVTPAFRTVMLREPVDNVISIFFYWKSLFETTFRAHALFEYVKVSDLSLIEFVKIKYINRLMSDYYFPSFDMRKFNVIGDYSNRSAYFSELSDKLGINFEDQDRVNITPHSEERKAVMSDQRIMKEIRAHLSEDIRFYENCLNITSHRMSFK